MQKLANGNGQDCCDGDGDGVRFLLARPFPKYKSYLIANQLSISTKALHRRHGKSSGDRAVTFIRQPLWSGLSFSARFIRA